jgi:hypothetical protein
VNQRHRVLLGEAGVNAFSKIGIVGVEAHASFLGGESVGGDCIDVYVNVN